MIFFRSVTTRLGKTNPFLPRLVLPMTLSWLQLLFDSAIDRVRHPTHARFPHEASALSRWVDASPSNQWAFKTDSLVLPLWLTSRTLTRPRVFLKQKVASSGFWLTSSLSTHVTFQRGTTTELWPTANRHCQRNKSRRAADAVTPMEYPRSRKRSPKETR